MILMGLIGIAETSCSKSNNPPDIILISIDSLRPDRLSSYGHHRETSPNIDRLALDSVLFENAFSTTSWTLPSHVSMLTGLYPEAHGVVKGKQKIGDEALLLSEILQQSGYQTLGVVAGPYLRTKFGFDQGWDNYDDYTIRIRGTRATTGRPVTPRQHRRILEMLDKKDERPLFLFLHYWDVHYDYNPPEPWRSQFDPDYEGDLDASFFTRNDRIHPDMDPRDLEHVLALYDGEIAFTDHYIGLLLEELRRRGLYDDAMIVLTSDHGDEFFEHGQKGHRANLYNATLRIPLIVKFPNNRWGGSRVGVPVSVVDIAPTVLELVGQEGPGGAAGRSLSGLVGSSARMGSRAIFADLGDTDKSMVVGSWKLISGAGVPGGVEIYDLSEDPGEQTNLAAGEEPRSQKMLADHSVWLRLARGQASGSGGEAIEYDEETREVLESLGYLD